MSCEGVAIGLELIPEDSLSSMDAICIFVYLFVIYVYFMLACHCHVTWSLQKDWAELKVTYDTVVLNVY